MKKYMMMLMSAYVLGGSMLAMEQHPAEVGIKHYTEKPGAFCSSVCSVVTQDLSTDVLDRVKQFVGVAYAQKNPKGYENKVSCMLVGSEKFCMRTIFSKPIVQGNAIVEVDKAPKHSVEMSWTNQSGGAKILKKHVEIVSYDVFAKLLGNAC